MEDGSSQGLMSDKRRGPNSSLRTTEAQERLVEGQFSLPRSQNAPERRPDVPGSLVALRSPNSSIRELS